ncbi:MAG: hypothetical protein Q8L48_19465 [Archangium sp.]|nr:hypothetical protein [Archangium sp.]
MSNSALTIEALFGDLNLEVGLQPEALEVPNRLAVDSEFTLDGHGFTPASAFLSDSSRQRTGSTRPYEVPEDEFAQSVMLWGDDERFSTVCTTPVVLDELPEDAYPPRFTLIEPDELIS